jgi:uncharacterized phage protein gp47/JayE
VKADSTTTTVSFERATAVPIYVDVDVVSSVGVSAADVKAAVVAAMSDRLVGADVVIKKIEAAVLALDGVDDLDFVQIGTAPSPSGTANISISSTQIATFSTSNIVVTGDAS